MGYEKTFERLASLEAEMRQIDCEYAVEVQAKTGPVQAQLDGIKSQIDQRYGEKTNAIKSRLVSNAGIKKFAKDLRDSRKDRNDCLYGGNLLLGGFGLGYIALGSGVIIAGNILNSPPDPLYFLIAGFGTLATSLYAYTLGKSFYTIRKLEKAAGGKENLEKIKPMLDRFVKSAK